MENKNHITISIEVKKAFNEVQHLFMIKTLSKVGVEGAYLNIIKAIYEKNYSQHPTQWAKVKGFSLRSGTRQGCLLSPLLFNIVLDCLLYTSDAADD